MKEVYLDHAAATPLDGEVFVAMQPFLTERYGNPSSFHTRGKEGKDALDAARASIAAVMNARADEILFTAGGTESDNLAILGVARAHANFGKHLITSKAEHQAVLETMMHLEKKEGFSVTYLDPDREGKITAKQVEEALRPDTILVSIMYANNEIGTIEPVASIVGLAKAFEMAQARRVEESARLIPLRDQLTSGIQKYLQKVRLNGHPTDRLPNNV